MTKFNSGAAREHLGAWAPKTGHASLLQLLAMGAAAAALAGGAQAASLTPVPSYVDPNGGTTTVLDINNAGWMTGAITEPDGSSLGFVRDAAGVYSTFSV